ncbi:hypothetical protein PGIGA_G00166070, partial [Pangasianodon gigas]|nr:hypothetical protein [Pangasianodon gigas]
PWLSEDLEDVGVGGVLTERPHHVSALRVRDLHLILRCAVKQLKCFPELLDLVSSELHLHALGVKRRFFGWLGFDRSSRRWCWFGLFFRLGLLRLRLFGLRLLDFCFLRGHRCCGRETL